MGKASQRKKIRRMIENPNEFNDRKAPNKYTKEQINKLYKDLLTRWVHNGRGDVAVMKDGSEVFLETQEILNWKGWNPLNKKNIETHKVLIREKLAGKYDNADLETLLREAGYNVIKKN
ncbi:MAG: hypothetical protein QNJ70_29660 [Xenococcaceae cyanobacterium MO_207.B15]|nr:hypothetical protein [Xenococcaceae cyanobacterium MO_207.B15]